MQFSTRVKRRLVWYRTRFTINNPVVGRAIELTGNKVRMDGLRFSVDTPHVSTGHKSTIAFGLHEIEERALTREFVPPDIPIIEFGGGLGVVSCVANRKLRNPSDHIVVEANPSLVPVLTRNRDLNHCHFKIVNAALGYDAATIELALDVEFVGSSVVTQSENTVSVPTVTLADLSAPFDKFGVICDIEGAEAELIKREIVNDERVKYVLAEMHPAVLGEQAVDNLIHSLEASGFALKAQRGDCVLLRTNHGAKD